jgi:hypothetical protein
MKVSIEKFSVVRNATSRELVAEMSDFGPLGTEIFHRIYPDACDEGITVVGKTGIQADYYIAHEVKDGEGDLLRIILEPTRESIRRHPRVANTRVVLLND